MKKYLVLFTLIASVFGISGCDSSDSPAVVAKAFVEAQDNEDVDTLYKLGYMLEEERSDSKKEKMIGHLKESIQGYKMAYAQGEKIEKITVRDHNKKDEENGSVYIRMFIKYPNRDKEMEMNVLVKKDFQNEWRVEFPSLGRY